MSALVYERDPKKPERTAGFEERLGHLGWERLSVYSPSQKASRAGLYFDVWLNPHLSPQVAAIAIRGTEFSHLNDWHSNFRWLLQGFPGGDQYDIVNNELKPFFADYRTRIGSGNLAVITTGHSLGGGLAQCVLYEWKAQIRQAYVFDSSPVTAFVYRGKSARDFFSYHPPLEGFPAHVILRVYERGEILAYFRSTTRLVWPIKEQIGEIRFNADIAWDPINQHSMSALARAILNTAQWDGAYPESMPRPWYWGRTTRPPIPAFKN